jgi:hypothetical protein
MEIAIPLLALSGLYVISNQQRKKTREIENFDANLIENSALPNTNIPNRNFPEEFPVQNAELDTTAKLAVDNRYDGPRAWTDKFLNPSTKDNMFIQQDSGQRTSMAGNKDTKYHSLTGQMVDSEYFNHNNMVPFFGAKIRSRKFEANSTESLMDNYLGTGSTTISKTEQSPLFSPDENYNWAHGAPNNSDFYQSRVNPSMNMANVKPFQEQRVAPGVGLGYGTEGAAGFNSGMLARDQWIDKNVDELRVANHQKAEGIALLGHEGPAISYVTSLGSIGQQEKHRPERAFEMGQNRLMTTTGAEKGQTLRAVPIEKTVNRPDTSTGYAGGAAASNPSSYVEGEYMSTHRNSLNSYPMSNVVQTGKGGSMEADFGKRSTNAYANNRSANKQNDYFGAIGGAIGAITAPILDVLRPSRKQNVIGTLRPYQNPSTTVPTSYIFNPADRTGTTIRQTTENSKFHLNVNARQHGGAYVVAEQQPIMNERMNQSDFYYAGNSSAGASNRQTRTYDAEYNQRNNDIKASTIDGRMVPGNMSLMNASVNMHGKAKDDYMKQNRALNPSMPSVSPSINTVGMLQGKTPLYQNIQSDRVTPDLLNALKGNPYAINMSRGL